MSWKGMMLKSGISSDGKSIDIFRGIFKVRGAPISVGRFTYEDFKSHPVNCKAAAAGGAVGTTGTNLMAFGQNVFECHIKGTQTATVPQMAAGGGLDVSGDATADDGFEITQGILAGGKAAFVVGTDAFYAKLKLLLTDVSGTDDCAFGFREAEAYQANIDDYTDMACFNIISGAIKTETILNNAATVTTDTTDVWEDTDTHTLEVYVAKTRAVTYKVDGAAPTVVAAYSLANTLVVVPFFYFLQHTDIAESTVLLEWEVGLQL